MLAMYFRAIKLPVQYIPLAKGDSTSYLLLEAIYDVILVIAVILNFNRLGLVGAWVGDNHCWLFRRCISICLFAMEVRL